MISIEDIFYITKGSLTTLSYGFVAYAIGLVLGSFIGYCRTLTTNQKLKYTAESFTSFIMGTPVMVQVMALYYALPQVVGLKLSGFVSCSIALSINSAAYISNVFVSGINAMPRQERDAAKLFGISPIAAYFELFLPTMMRDQLPSLLGELSSLMKETVVVAMVGETDIMRRAYLVASRNFEYVSSMMVAAITYYAMVSILNYASRIAKSHLNR